MGDYVIKSAAQSVGLTIRLTTNMGLHGIGIVR